ncbi:MAG: hypothetical protein QMC67_14740 [Candidatus Wallbacteria bacterium]
MSFPPPGFDFEILECPKCKLPVDENELFVECPKCFAKHHKRCVHEGVKCGNSECDYIFHWSEEDGTLIFPEYTGPERRIQSEDRRKNVSAPPDGIERRTGPRRRSDF